MKRLLTFILSLSLLLSIVQPAGAQFSGTDLKLQMRETDQTLPAGLWRFHLNGDVFALERNTAVAGNFSTSATVFSATTAGEFRIQTAPVNTPFTQSRLTIYRDPSNWAYFSYGSDATLRQVYSSTASNIPLQWGLTNATDGTGTFTQTMQHSNGSLILTGVSSAAGVRVNSPFGNQSTFYLQSAGVDSGAVYRPVSSTDLMLWTSTGGDAIDLINTPGAPVKFIGALGIRVSPSYPFDVATTITDTTTLRGANSAFTSNNPSGTRSSGVAFYGFSTQGGAGTTTTLVGTYGLATQTAGTVTRLEGLGANAILTTGTATNVSAAAGVTNINGGTATDVSVLRSEGVVIGGGTTTNAYGLYINSNSKSAGALTRNYGIKIDDQNIGSVTNYALYTGAGAVRFGDTVSMFDTTNSTGQFYVGSNSITFAVLDSIGSTGSVLQFQQANGSQASRTNSANNDKTGIIANNAYSGGGYFGGAQINFVVDGTFTSGQRPPSRIEFYTNPANTAQTLAMILDRLGNLGIEGHITAPSIILGSPAGGDPGTGGVNLTALFLNGVQVTPPTVASTTVASSSTPTPTDAKDSEFTVTALAVNATFAAPSGSPAQGHRLLIRVTDNGTSRTLAWNAIYRASSDLALPTATTLGKTMYLAFEYNATASKWDFLSMLDNF